MIRVVGRGGGPAPDLTGATLVVGAPRHLADVEPPAGARVLALADVAEAVRELAAHDGEAVVLASGDPGFFGLVRRLRAAGLPLRVEPAVSAVAAAFARAGVEWDDALVVSAHGRDPRPALAAVRAGGKVAVLTDGRTGPREVAAAAPPGARLVVAERLGAPDERVTCGTPAEVAAGAYADPNVVLVLDGGAPAPAPAPWRAGPAARSGWALPDEQFEHRDAMLTKREVRAQVLALLAPAPGVLVWDLGAGSGAVGIECARLGAAAVLVDRDGDQCARARRNAQRHGVTVDVRQGVAGDLLAELPHPDAVFVGGGGPELLAQVAARRPDRVVATLAQLERVAPAAAALGGYATETVLLQAHRVVPLAGGSRLAPANPVFVVSGVRGQEP